MSVDFGINLADIWTNVTPVLGQLWPVIALVVGLSLAFSIGSRIKWFAKR